MTGAEHHSILEDSLRTRPEKLARGVSVEGLAGAHSVDVVAVGWQGSNYITVTYRDEHVATAQALLGRDREPRLRVAPAGRTQPGDGHGEGGPLAAEALRVRVAAQFDPMLAITTEITQCLPDSWKPRHRHRHRRATSTPQQVNAERPTFGQHAMTGRLARSVFLVSARWQRRSGSTSTRS